MPIPATAMQTCVCGWLLIGLTQDRRIFRPGAPTANRAGYLLLSVRLVGIVFLTHRDEG
jgi:hypothetical protein